MTFSLVEEAPFGVLRVDSAFRLIRVSAGCGDVFRNVDPLLGRAFAEVLRIVWPEPFASEAIARFTHTLRTGESCESPGVVELRRDLGVKESYDRRLEGIRLPGGDHGVVCYFYDLTPVLRMEQALRESEREEARQRELFEKVSANIPVLLALRDPSLERFTLNREAERVLGWTTDEADTADDFLASIYPDRELREKVAAFMQAREPGWREFSCTRPDGEVVPVEWANVRLTDESTIGIGVDRWERCRVEEALQRAHDELEECMATRAAEIRQQKLSFGGWPMSSPPRRTGSASGSPPSCTTISSRISSPRGCSRRG